MNTLQNLLDNGIEEYTANKMLSEYKSKIGTMNGIYKVIDINYDFNERGKDVFLECSKCGKVIHRMMISGRNKWSELIKSCPCQKEEKRREEQLALENSERIKRDNISADAKSLIGTNYGDYEVIGFKFDNGKPIFTLKCRECGDITTSHYQRVKTNTKTYQKCRKHYAKPIKYDESYIGRKKNFLTVKSITRLPKNKHKAFVCECDCGNKTIIEPTFWEQGIVKSCGCKRLELLSEANKVDNPLNKIRLYHVYINMKSRCYNPNSDSYKYYGARGIKICDEWLNDFWKFYKWAYENGYDENTEKGECTIERKDVNGNYEPSNCEWITNAEQQKNKRTNVFITMNGETKILSDWHKENGMSLYILKKIANGEEIRKDKMDKFIHVRFSKSEREELEKFASSLGMTSTEYLRDLIYRDMKATSEKFEI